MSEEDRRRFAEVGGWRQFQRGGAASATTCPPSAVVDQIIPWPDVREGDLLLWDGEFRPVVAINSMDHGNHAIVFDPDKPGGIIPCGTYAAVRRYQEG